LAAQKERPVVILRSVSPGTLEPDPPRSQDRASGRSTDAVKHLGKVRQRDTSLCGAQHSVAFESSIRSIKKERGTPRSSLKLARL